MARVKRGPFRNLNLASDRLHPTGTNVLVMRDDPEQRFGSLIIPDAHKTKKITGVIAAVGPSVDGLKAGQRVMISKFGSVEFEVDNPDKTRTAFMVLDQSSICLVIADDELQLQEGE